MWNGTWIHSTECYITRPRTWSWKFWIEIPTPDLICCVFKEIPYLLSLKASSSVSGNRKSNLENFNSHKGNCENSLQWDYLGRHSPEAKTETQVCRQGSLSFSAPKRNRQESGRGKMGKTKAQWKGRFQNSPWILPPAEPMRRLERKLPLALLQQHLRQLALLVPHVSHWQRAVQGTIIQALPSVLGRGALEGCHSDKGGRATGSTQAAT